MGLGCLNFSLCASFNKTSPRLRSIAICSDLTFGQSCEQVYLVRYNKIETLHRYREQSFDAIYCQDVRVGLNHTGTLSPLNISLLPSVCFVKRNSV